MKRLCLVLPALLVLLCLLCACGETNDTWERKAATAFDGGSGTKEDPYRIATGAQLAYLAKQVNEGITYEGQRFLLTADLDMQELPWTPIGNQETPFMGVFNGGCHTISRLKLQMNVYEQDIPEMSLAYRNGYAGLFGFCRNSCIQDLRLQQVSYASQEGVDIVFVGGVAACYEVTDTCEIRNVQVDGLTMLVKPLAKGTKAPPVSLGGIAGEYYVAQGAGSLARVHATVRVEAATPVDMGFSDIGGLIGNLAYFSTFSCTDFSCELEAKYVLGENVPVGAVGSVIADPFGKIALANFTNGACRLSLQVWEEDATDYPLGLLVGSGADRGVMATNVFGYGVVANEVTYGYVQPISELCKAPAGGAVHTEIHCGGLPLPQEHGLDPAIWELSDPAAPRIRFQAK